MLEVLRASIEQGRQWFRPVSEGRFGIVAWVRGEFDAADSHLKVAKAGQRATDQQPIDAVWLQPMDPIASTYLYLALTRFVRGDLTEAEAELAQAARRAGQLSFPQGPFSLAYTRFVEIWLRTDAGQLDRAVVLVADLIEQAERHGFDHWRLIGATQQATVGALAALGADHVDPAVLSTHIATLTTLLDTWRTVGLLIYVTSYDAVLARLFTAAGQPEQARARLGTALQLAEDTGMHFYDAELRRLRARTHTEPDARQADINAALELARRQGATLFELRAALDDYELRGEPARAALIDAVSRIPGNNAWPELARAQATLSEDSPRI